MSLLRKGVKTPQILFFNLNPVLKDGASELLYITINVDTYTNISVKSRTSMSGTKIPN